MKDSFINKLFSFRFITLCGMVMAFYVFSLTTEARPLSMFLFKPTLYAVASLVALAVHIMLWVVVDKGSTYDFSRHLTDTIQDCVIINLVLLCTLSFLFLLSSFI